ncbi:uncharacterized protein CXQ87_004714 [Candidozyma duobushaemuli]|uniref:GH16 domain-containing protein n=2 Tax=Candidozyma TaxID=3303203 RepID=A0ABX8IDN1_9ASCO|nr:uncharacterized protein CXQ87_004714 [[Candida] duobushaemulonis]PVH16423.1 hypothetical protein CXQ87_004714 [[Candida] duobushaemulonis]QWU90192.1 hypothetical protein CA3LBN_004553 [[Candida] haemuloni]
MSHRDLTNNGYVDSPRNPFDDGSGSYDSSHFDEAASDELLQHSPVDDSNRNSYNGYYVDRNTRPMSSPSQQGNLVAPTEFNRYPSLANSREHSSTSLSEQFKRSHSQYTQLTQNGSETTSSNGENVSDPFLAKVDLSPFGGYPADQFPLHIDEKEPDDYLHNPDPIADAAYDKNRFWYDLKHMDRRVGFGLLGFILLLLGAIAVFILIPVLTFSGVTNPYKPESYEVLTPYTYPLSSAIRTSLIDPDTPEDEHTRVSSNGDEWVLTFSDEFNAEGRTFYDGDDQFFQAVDIHYQATQDLEWYDPDAATTSNGTLHITLDAYKNHDLFYRSAMLQSWNKMCFSEGLIVTSVNLPNYGHKLGLWPGLWTLGNLARPGYLASTEGVWPYTYDSCDAGITANQSSPDGISYLPGQKLNACTCSGQDHPNAGTGRGAPEIDIIEGSIDDTLKTGVVSMSYQIAPYDVWYYPDYSFIEIHNNEVCAMNTYTGGPFQQAVSGLVTLNTTWYERGEGAGKFQEYGYEYMSDNDDGYITWYVGKGKEGAAFTLHAWALSPNGNIGWRRISKEPMAIVINLGISNSWAYIDWPSLIFPSHMRVDYVRIYQPPNSISMTCDPDGYPTTEYIENHKDAYYNNNHTSWEMAGFTFPKNKVVGC